MRMRKTLFKLLLLGMAVVFLNGKSMAQNLHFGLYVEPLISWFGSDTDATVSDGARPGMAFGISLERYFARNYAFTGGISITNAAGRLRHNQDMLIWLKDTTEPLDAGDKITYKISYLSLPVGIKLKTNTISYTIFSADIGVSPKIIVGGKASIPSLQIEKESITQELKFFALGYYIKLGAEYPLGGRTAFTGGIGYENVFSDVTKDRDGQPGDRVSHHIILIKMGLNF